MAQFAWEDYIVFSIMLVISSGIGLFFAARARRRKETSSDELLTGNHTLPMFPVAMSLSASFTSATTILGIPAEVYTRGGEQWLWIFGLIPCFLIIGFFMLPIIFKLHLTNAYEYLELRFSKPIRTLGSVSFSVIIIKTSDDNLPRICRIPRFRSSRRLMQLLYMAAVLYAPSVALSQVTGLSSEISIVAIGLVCTFYTSIGGIRGVVWTDAFQLIIVWAGLMALMFKGASDVGGWSRVWEISKNGSRLPKFDMDPNPFVRHTFWTLFIGGGFNMMTVYGANQTNLQRYSSVRTLREAKIALLLNLPIWIFYLTILCLLGLVMYAFFVDCDPLTSGIVSKGDQLIPHFVLETMGKLPGLPGLFIASIFSASISTLSSGINSLGAVTLEDLMKPLYYKCKKQELSKSLSTLATILLVILFGGLTIALAYLASFMGKTAIMISFGVFGIVGGPLLGLLMNGMFVPYMNSYGAGAGWLVSVAVCFYVGTDPVFHPAPKGYLPLTQCSAQDVSAILSNITTISTTILQSTGNVSTTGAPVEPESNDRLYLSYIHYATLALLISFIVGSIVSAITGFNKGKQVDERTYYKYSWCCSSASRSSYDLNQTADGGVTLKTYDKDDLKEVDENSHFVNSNHAHLNSTNDKDYYIDYSVENRVQNGKRY